MWRSGNGARKSMLTNHNMLPIVAIIVTCLQI